MQVGQRVRASLRRTEGGILDLGDGTVIAPATTFGWDYIVTLDYCGHDIRFRADELQEVKHVGTFPFLNPGKGLV